MAIRRYSSRTDKLDQSFLLKHLQGAKSYQRIAGYFTSSLFEVAEELLEAIPLVQIVCNSDIHFNDLRVAKQRDARLLGRWNEDAAVTDSLLNRDRYRHLDAFLAKHGNAIRVAPDSVCGFVHGKAGVITLASGEKLGFIGSMNESRNGWHNHYEILWEDDSPDGVAWIESEFEYLWNAGKELPRVIVREVHRRYQRQEVEFEDIPDDEDLAPAALIESPLYQQGYSLLPWQQGFVSECIRHYRNHKVVRLLLADEVGLGKTLAMGTAALALCLMMEREKKRRKPVLIFAPATLCEQWQVEMEDKLGIPCARWQTQKKIWTDPQGNTLSAQGARHIGDCPLRIGIVSTGLMTRDSVEKATLLGLNLGLVILDEAHKARTRGGVGKQADTPNELLKFAKEMAARADHVLLGTATPMQTRFDDLWDLLSILHQGDGNFVLGHDLSPWHKPDEVLPIITGESNVTTPEEAWELLRSPLPMVDSTNDRQARKLYQTLREDLDVKSLDSRIRDMHELSDDALEELEDVLHSPVDGATFFQRENPLVRHIVLRKRSTLEDKGMLDRIAVEVHPNIEVVSNENAYRRLFADKGLRIDENFRAAYDQARTFAKALAQRGKGAGFMKNLLEQRICSSVVAGIATAERMLQGQEIETTSDEEEVAVFDDRSAEEESALEQLIERLKKVPADPKLGAILHYLNNEGWLEHGVIIFSQYYDTAKWVAEQLALQYPDRPVGLYAGADRSKLFRGEDSNNVEREQLKRNVADRKLTIMVATDAACEGLNLQTLGTLINVDLPWNPTRLEQRIGRIKRYGQTREKVDMLNLVNSETVDERVYDKLSARMQDRFDLFGSLPDTIDDSWIDDIESMDEKMDDFIDARKRATGFDLRYNDSLNADEDAWRDCSDVLSQRDFRKLMQGGWENR